MHFLFSAHPLCAEGFISFVSTKWNSFPSFLLTRTTHALKVKGRLVTWTSQKVLERNSVGDAVTNAQLTQLPVADENVWDLLCPFLPASDVEIHVLSLEAALGRHCISFCLLLGTRHGAGN